MYHKTLRNTNGERMNTSMENSKITPFDSIIADEDKKINDENVTDFSALAVEKIKNELKSFSGGNKETAVSKFVAEKIIDFCEQNKDFAKVVYKFKRTLSDCCAAIMHKTGNCVSDIEVYKKAIQFYFPNTEITMTINIKQTGDAPDESEILKEIEKPKPKPAPVKKPTPKKETKKKAAPVEKKVAKAKEQPANIQLTLF